MVDLYCDICGKTPVRAQILLEGAKLLACGSCMRGGKILYRFEEDAEGAPVQMPKAPPSSFEPREEIIEDCGKVIKKARDRLKLPLAVVAERISEKESYLDAIENGRLMPSLAVAKKLERELGIKLIQKTEQSVGSTATASGSKFSPPTLGDMVSSKKKK